MRKLKLEELNRPDIETFKRRPKKSIIVLLDNVRSGLNVGSVFRSSDAFAIEKIILTGITPCPPHREINKTAIGATTSVEWAYHEDATEALKSLKDEGYKLIGIEQTDESSALSSFKVDSHEQYALIFGNEVSGISENLLPFLDDAVEIAQYGTKHSLNVSVCAGIVLWTFTKDLKG